MVSLPNSDDYPISIGDGITIPLGDGIAILIGDGITNSPRLTPHPIDDGIATQLR